jgi:hypothetical protein
VTIHICSTTSATLRLNAFQEAQKRREAL